jgi:hypothetical protein
MRRTDAQVGVRDLAFAGLAPQLSPNFVKLGNAGRTDRMPLTFQTAGGVDRLQTVQACLSLGYGLEALTGFEKAQIFDVKEFGDGKTIVHF